MSRTPIRQALMRLKNEGLLEEQIGKKNYRVSTITKEDIQDLFDFREGIETTAFMLSWRNGITPEQLENLQEITDKMKETKDAGQAKEHFFYDQQFHNELVALSNNKRLIKAHDEILLQLTRMRFLSFLENSLQSKACIMATEIPFQKAEIKSIMRKVADWQIANPHPAPEHDDLNWPQGAL